MRVALPRRRIWKGRRYKELPTPNPSVLNDAVATTVTLFTSNYATFITAAVALLGIISIPVLVIRGGLRLAVRGLGRIFRSAH